MKYVIRFSIFIFFDQIESDLSKWIKTDQTWSNWISDETIIEICISSDFQLYFWSQFYIVILGMTFFFSVSNLLFLVLTWNFIFFLFSFPIWSFIHLFFYFSPKLRSYLFCPKWIKMEQTWSNWISDEIIIEIYNQIFNFFWSD